MWAFPKSKWKNLLTKWTTERDRPIYPKQKQNDVYPSIMEPTCLAQEPMCSEQPSSIIQLLLIHASIFSINFIFFCSLCATAGNLFWYWLEGRTKEVFVFVYGVSASVYALRLRRLKIPTAPIASRLRLAGSGTSAINASVFPLWMPTPATIRPSSETP